MTPNDRTNHARPTVPTLTEIFWSPLANGFRKMAEWRRRGILGKALRMQRSGAMRFEALEPRLLLSADLTHVTPPSVALDATLKVEDMGGAAILRLIDNPSSAVLAEQLLDQDVNVSIRGSDQSDRLTIGFDRAALAHQVRIDFDGADGGMDELVGPDRANTWLLDGPGAGSLNGDRFSGLERVTGGDADDTFVMLDAAASTEVHGGAGDDTLIGADADNTWEISAEDEGTLNAVSFSGIENLTGGAGNDTFIFAGGSISGTVDGGEGINTFDYGSRTESVIVNLETGSASDVAAMVNVTRVVGGQANDTLVGRSEDSTWTVGGRNAGGVGSVQFTQIENVTGGAGADTFAFGAEGSLDGAIVGGLGTDSLVGANRANQWVIDGTDAGTLNDIAFIDVENIFGGEDSDVVTLLAAGGLAGTASGGAGQDRVRGPDRKTVWRFTGSGSGDAGGVKFTGMESLEGGEDEDTLAGPAADSSWVIDGPNSGNVGGAAFAGMEILQGAAQNQDTFTVQAGGSVSLLDGGAGGFDTLVIEEGPYENVVSTATGPDSGSIALDATVVRYSGLEPVIVNAGSTANQVYNLTAGSDQVTLRWVSGFTFVIDSLNGTFEDTQFTTSDDVSSITINLGGGDDVLTISTVRPATTAWSSPGRTIRRARGHSTFRPTWSTARRPRSSPARWKSALLAISRWRT